MSRFVLPASALLAVLAGIVAFSISGPHTARGDVGGVYANVPVFTPNQVVNITVTAEDDDGVLIITSSLDTSHLTVTNCTGIGNDQGAGQCDSSGMASVITHGGAEVRIDTNGLDSDFNTELLTVSLTLTATCSQVTVVTVSGDQPGNVGPDNVTINCAPATPTPSPTPSPTPTNSPTATPIATNTPAPTATPANSSTPIPTPTFTPQPPAAPTATPFSEIQTVIKPPSTGSGGLR
jgi:hypothetical protein